MAINKLGASSPLQNPPLTISLSPSETFLLPAGQGIVGTFGGANTFTGMTLTGQYIVSMGPYTSLQTLDPNLGVWRNLSAASTIPITISSDGTNFRLANTTGVPIGMLVTNAGSGLTNGFNTVTITPSTGGSTWASIVGGAIATGIAVTGSGISAGSGYIKPPLLVFNPPANQGSTPYILPSAICTIASGTISTVTVLNQGGGLVAAPVLNILNQPGDTVGSGGVLQGNVSLAASGSLVAAFPLTYGTTGLAAAPTFTFAPASSIAGTAIMNFCVTGVSLISGGAGYPQSLFAVQSAGGQVAGSAAANTAGPVFDKALIFPRNVSITGLVTGGVVQVAANLTIYDQGFGFQATPNLFVVSGGTGGTAATGLASVTAQVGGVNDTSVIQPI